MLKKFISLLLTLSLLNTTNIFAAVTPPTIRSYKRIGSALTTEQQSNSQYIGYTLTWTQPLARLYSYLGDSFPTTRGSSGTEGNKRIVYTDMDGNTCYANPYQPGSITIKIGTAVKFQMIEGNGGQSIIVTYLNSTTSTPNQTLGNYRGNYSIITHSFTPTGPTILTQNEDFSVYAYSSYSSYGWYMIYTPLT